MKKEINTLFALFRCAVLDKEMSDADKNEAAEKASLLFDMARHHDLAHLLDYAYKKSGIGIDDGDVAYKFIRYQALSVMRHEDLSLALTNVSELFEQNGICFVPLKGAVIKNLYPQRWMRTSCDIDILVHEEDLEKAEKLLCEKLGYTSKGERDYHDISLFSDTGVHVELHFNIKENMENIDRLLEKVWDYALPKTAGSYEYVLTNEFLLFQHIAHMSYHVVGGGCSIRYFLDLYLLDNKLEYDKSVFEKMLSDCALEKFYELSLKLANIWFSDEEHDEITLIYQKYLLNGGVYGTKINGIAANSDKKSTFSYVMGRVFMPYEQLCLKYPSLKGKKLLLPFYQVRRWCGALVKGRISDTSKEIDANSKITEEGIAQTRVLFEKLKLKKNDKK